MYVELFSIDGELEVAEGVGIVLGFTLETKLVSELDLRT